MADIDPNQPQNAVLPDNSSPANLSSGLAPNVVGPSIPASKPSMFGQLFHKISSGTDTQYSIDPSSGKTTATQVPEKPGQLFRNILAAGLLGGSGIDPQNGYHTLAQGLLAGVSGGTKAGIDLHQQQDDRKRAQAQQDYANQLKAQDEQRKNSQEDRESKESQARLDLNKVSLVNENLRTTAQHLTIDNMLRNNEGAAADLLVAGSKDKLQDYMNAEVKPFQENLTEDDLHKLMTDQPGVSSKYQALPTGKKVITDAQGNQRLVPTYSLYDPLTKVTDGMLNRARATGLDKTNPAMFNEMADAHKNGKDVDFRKISAFQNEVGKQVNFNDILAKQTKEKAEIARDYASANASGLDAKLKGLQIKDLESNQLGKQIFYGIGNDVGFTRPGTKEVVKIPVNANGGYDFSALKPEEKVGVGNYLSQLQETAQGDFDKNLTALKADPENKSAQANVTSLANTLSTFNNMRNNLTGRKESTLARAPIDPVQKIAQKYTDNLSPVAGKAFSAISSLPFDQGLAQIRGATGLSPEDRENLLTAYEGFVKESQPIKEEQQTKNSELDKKLSQQQVQEQVKSGVPIIPHLQF